MQPTTPIINEEIDPLMSALRENLGVSRNTATAQVDQNKANAFQQIMENANAAGMLYSTFPERMKIQYVGDTVVPNKLKIDTAYQTGLGDLRSTGASIASQIKSYADAIAEMNAV